MTSLDSREASKPRLVPHILSRFPCNMNILSECEDLAESKLNLSTFKVTFNLVTLQPNLSCVLQDFARRVQKYENLLFSFRGSSRTLLEMQRFLGIQLHFPGVGHRVEVVPLPYSQIALSALESARLCGLVSIYRNCCMYVLIFM